MEGLVNVKTLQLTTEYAFPAIVDHLKQVADVDMINISTELQTVTISFSDTHAVSVSDCLTDYILGDWLSTWLISQLLQRIHPSYRDDLEHLMLMTVHEVKSGTKVVAGRSYSEWNARSKQSIRVLLETHQTMSIDGFVRFRLRLFAQELGDDIYGRLQQLTLDKEYEESVSMLRFMLDSQPESQQEIHVFSSPDRVWLTDVTGCLLRDGEITEAALLESDDDLDSEDLAMSILITRSPCKIVLHDLYPNAVWPSFSETLMRVFAERVYPCNHCSTCKQLEQAQYRMSDDKDRHHRLGPNRS